jgi:hypothetical protein
MTDQSIDYETLAQDALRGVVRTVLTRVATSDKLPGNHHFYISFNTRADGVSISRRLREQYPDEMTIVLQHRYWDLHVHDDRFEVKLTFNNIPERLVIPFRALKVFFDPSVPYGLQFDTGAPRATMVASPDAADAQQTAPKAPAVAAAPKRPAKPRPVPALRPEPRPRPVATSPDSSTDPNAGPAAKLPSAPSDPSVSEEAQKPETPGPGRVVRLDAFRKK